MNVAKYLPQIQHLHLRYLRRITDKSINAICHYMKYSIYVLDISFCTKITNNAILSLVLDTKCLSELKLYNCRQITSQGLNNIVSYLSTLEFCSLAILDLRCCGVDFSSAADNAMNGDNVSMVENIIRCLVTRMRFEHKINGFFVRNVKWNKDMESAMLN